MAPVGSLPPLASSKRRTPALAKARRDNGAMAPTPASMASPAIVATEEEGWATVEGAAAPLEAEEAAATPDPEAAAAVTEGLPAAAGSPAAAGPPVVAVAPAVVAMEVVAVLVATSMRCQP